ncbi:hypothetical protein T01_3031 [Trichinella spiralis]|uniref:PiggyBac transposable element-derived protein domain-containing protein n=1 Tax=Trichinella spiralis TaxID=6334 RepID=A0A0V1BPR0_TRISP|nr:hypothetical protein T01_3031 [Trichinella spiralis]
MVLWLTTLDCAGLAAYVIWTCKNPDWNARKSQRRRLFLMECGKNLVDIVLQKRAASPPQSLPYTNATKRKPPGVGSTPTINQRINCVKLYAQQHFTSCFIVYFSLTPVLVITESIWASIFCSLPSSPESRIHHNFSRQISDDDI